MTHRPTLHPAYLQRAIDAEAEIWAISTDLTAWLNLFSAHPRSQAKLAEIVKQCFGEGFYLGVMAAKAGKSLNDSLAEVGAGMMPANNNEGDAT